jgi:N-formylglutamate amidohydrolase
MQGSVMVEEDAWTVVRGDGPVVAVALHAGHAMRREVEERMLLPAEHRLREEDPFTDRIAACIPTRVVATHSRFEVDFNRPREGAVYLAPEQAWGLELWATRPPADLIERSLAVWDAFHEMMAGLLEAKRERHGRFVVFDVHSYNHRRAGPAAPVADETGNPEVNVGTGSMDRNRWSRVVDGFMDGLRAAGPSTGGLDVREKVRFRGGHFAQWVHERFPESGCALAIEFKKTFMDEWTACPDLARIDGLARALASTIPCVTSELSR